VHLALAAQQIRVGRLSREPIAVLCQHHANAPGGHEDGWVYVGYIDEYGDEREASYACRRCADSR
jgi:hypothetical protein